MCDTKIAIIIRDDLAKWYKMNVTTFLMSGITAAILGLSARPIRTGAESGILRGQCRR